MKKCVLFGLFLMLSLSSGMPMQQEEPNQPPMDVSGGCLAPEHISVAVHELYVLSSLAQALAMKIESPVVPVRRLGGRGRIIPLQRSLSICDHHTKHLDPVIRRSAEFLLIGGEAFTEQEYVSHCLQVVRSIVGAIDELLIGGRRTPADLMAPHVPYDDLCSMVRIWPMPFCESIAQCGAIREQAELIRQNRALMAQVVVTCSGDCGGFIYNGGCLCSAMVRDSQNSKIWRDLNDAFGQQRVPVDMRGVLSSICLPQDAGNLPELFSGQQYSSNQIMFMLWVIANHLMRQIGHFGAQPEMHVDIHELERFAGRLEQLRACNFMPQ